MPAPTSEPTTQPLSERERSLLAAQKTGCRSLVGVLVFAALLGGVVPIVVVAMEPEGIAWGAIAWTALFVVFGLGLVAFNIDRADADIDAGIDVGIKRIIRGRIVQMRTDSSEGASPDRFMHVAVEESPPRTMVFTVNQAVYRGVNTGEAVRIAYVPASKTIVQLSTAAYAYSIGDEAPKDQNTPSGEPTPAGSMQHGQDGAAPGHGEDVHRDSCAATDRAGAQRDGERAHDELQDRPIDAAHTQALSAEDIGRLEALKPDGFGVAVLIVVITFAVLMMKWSSYGAVGLTLISLLGFALLLAWLLVQRFMRSLLQADIDGGVKRVAPARVVKLVESDAAPTLRIEMTTEEAPAQTFVFTPASSVSLKLEQGERIQLAYAPRSKTIMYLKAASSEYAPGAQTEG